MTMNERLRIRATLLQRTAAACMMVALLTVPASGSGVTPSATPATTASTTKAGADTGTPDVGASTNETRVVGYFTEWSKRYAVAGIPAEKLTHVNYAFAVIRDGECAMKDNLAAARHFPLLHGLKKKHPHLRTLISIGGWADSTGFYDAAGNPQSRVKFARSAAAFAREHGFDGVDIDWEYPGGGGKEKDKGGPEDTRNFTLLLQDLRRALDEQGKADQRRYLLTIAAPAGGQAKRIELAEIHKVLDFINLMTYDFAGHWNDRTGFNAPLYPWGENGPAALSADGAVRAYLDAGVPREKLVLGVPFYGRAFAGVNDDENHGLARSHSGKPPRATGSGLEWSWRSISKHYLDQGSIRHWHDQAKVPWLYDKEKELFVTYDDPRSLKLKAQYVRDRNLGGVMIWELSQDDDKSTLLDALREGLHR